MHGPKAIENGLLLGRLCAATQDVFSTMLDLSVTPDGHYMRQNTPEPLDGIEVLVAFTGMITGAGGLCCSDRLACWLSSRFLLAEFETVDDEVLDAMGELANMVVGNLKTELEGDVGALAMGIPTVIHGRELSTRMSKSKEWIFVPFAIAGERLYVKVCIAQNGHNARADTRICEKAEESL